MRMRSETYKQTHADTCRTSRCVCFMLFISHAPSDGTHINSQDPCVQRAKPKELQTTETYLNSLPQSLARHPSSQIVRVNTT